MIWIVGMIEIKLRALPKDFDGELSPGDVYYANYLKDWIICLPIPNSTPQRPFVEFALNTIASNGCPHEDKKTVRHRCWQITGDVELENGDASKLTISPSILMEYDPGMKIHGWIRNGVWSEV